VIHRVIAVQDGEDPAGEIVFEALDMPSDSRDRGSRFDEQNIGIAPRRWIKSSSITKEGFSSKRISW
jgi:hypothetical protein